jgi:hypothetical protein
MKKRSILIPILLVSLTFLSVNSFSGCCWGDSCWGGSNYDYNDLTFDEYVDLFAQAFVDNDTSLASTLKSLYPSFYNRMLDNLNYNSKNKEKTKDERNAAALFYAWALLVK